MASETDDTNRRDFLMIAAGSFAAVGGTAALWPFIDQMNPDASALSLATIEVDLSKVEEGQAITAMWRGKPIFIRHRSQSEVDASKKVSLDELPDQKSRNQGLGKTEEDNALDANRTKTGKEKWLILVGVCTHLGCVPKGNKLGDNKGEYDGWFCPCHGSHYDTAGRIRKGPAPENLPIPPYEFISDTLIKIG